MLTSPSHHGLANAEALTSEVNPRTRALANALAHERSEPEHRWQQQCYPLARARAPPRIVAWLSLFLLRSSGGRYHPFLHLFRHRSCRSAFPGDRDEKCWLRRREFNKWGATERWMWRSGIKLIYSHHNGKKGNSRWFKLDVRRPKGNKNLQIVWLKGFERKHYRGYLMYEANNWLIRKLFNWFTFNRRSDWGGSKRKAINDWLENPPSSTTSCAFAVVGLPSPGIVMENVDWGIMSLANGERRRSECGEVVLNWFITTVMVKMETRVHRAELDVRRQKGNKKLKNAWFEGLRKKILQQLHNVWSK
jgi:hypothetical protein